MTKAKNDASAWYAHSYLAGVEPDFTGGWPKSLGSKPTADMLETAHYFSPQGPGKQAFALALTLRPEGVTRGQISALFQGHQQSNHRQAQIDAGYFDRLAFSVPGVDRSKCYKLELTDLGKAFIERRKADKAAKAEAVRAKLEGKAKQVKSPAEGQPPKAEKPKLVKLPQLEVKAAPKAKRPAKAKPAKGTDQPVADQPAAVPAEAVSLGSGIDALTA